MNKTLEHEKRQRKARFGSAATMTMTSALAVSLGLLGCGPGGSSGGVDTGAGGAGTSPVTTGSTGGTTATTSTGGTTMTSSTGGTTPPPVVVTGTGGAAGTGTGTGSGGTGVTPPPPPPPAAGNKVKQVFVIAMENEPAAAIYGNSAAPYINNQLMPSYAHGTAFTDPLPDAIPSEPHYVWMEAGTNAFSDTTFTTDADPSASNSTASTAHLTAQMAAASPAVTWLSFQEGLNSSTGACPISSSGFYAAKHDPFVFFRDVAGSPPSASNANCAAHHRAYTQASFAQALAQGDVGQYNFITPNVCNDMHGGGGCPSGDVIAIGDQWLQANLPPLIDYVNAHDGVIFIVWDEPEGGSKLIAFLAIGPHVKANYTSAVPLDHGSLVKTVEKVFNLPVLPTVSSVNDFGDMFQAGFYP